MQRQFDRFDANRDGTISRAEFEMRGKQAHRGLTAQGAMPGRMAGSLSARELIGADVRNPKGTDLGEIEDLLIDVDSGKVRSAILSFGGFLDIGDKLFRYPLSDFSRSSEGDKLVLDVSRTTLDASRGFDRDAWPDWVSTDKGASTRAMGVWQASRLLGRDIDDRTGDHLGEIADIVVDSKSGNVDYVVMRYDRPWSLDNPLVAIPMNALTFGLDRRTVSMNVDRHQLDAQRVASGASTPDLWVERWIVIAPVATGTAATRDFDRLDTNRDGALSRSEYGTTDADRPFSSVDKDSNGSVTREEFAAAPAATRAASR